MGLSGGFVANFLIHVNDVQINWSIFDENKDKSSVCCFGL